MIDFQNALSNLEAYKPQRIQLTVINHELDRGGDNSATLKVDLSDPFIQNLINQKFDIDSIHLTEPRSGCMPSDPQIDNFNVHVLNFYLGLNNPVETTQTIGQLIHQ